MSSPAPNSLGAPAKFSKWRKGQYEAVLDAITSEKRFLGGEMPTGSGKSLYAVMQHLMTGERTVILTSTKGLQTQYIQDFKSIRMADIRGRGNYSCDYDQTVKQSCENAPCTFNVECSLFDRGCEYFDAVRRAKNSQLVVTNYAFWVSTNRYSEGIGDVDRLILDEGHDAPEELSQLLSIRWSFLDLSNCEYLTGTHAPKSEDPIEWREWANNAYTILGNLLDLPRRHQGDAMDFHGIKKLKDYKSRIEAMTMIDSADNWVVEHTDKGVNLDPVWPAPYAERYLFAKVPKVSIISATIRPKTMELLGIPPDQYDFFEYPSTFPIRNRPIYYWPTVRVSAKSTPEDMIWWVNKIDKILAARPDRKGIIHTVSFDRAKFVLSRSRFKDRLLLNESRNTQQIVRTFKESSKPLVLVSPSVTTGYDFPGAECEFQIIGKVPFSDTRSPVMQRRIELDRDYDAYRAMQTIIQSAGRSTRSETDRSEVFIIDDHFHWFQKAYRRFAPKWFIDSIKWIESMPEPLRKA